MLKVEIVFRPDAHESYIAVTERLSPERVSLTEVDGMLRVDQVDGIDVDDLPTLRQRIQVLVQEPEPERESERESEPEPRKFRTEPEGDMYRIYATGDRGRWYRGQRGGLLSHPRLLSQEGNCWVDEASQLKDNFQVSGDVEVVDGSVLSGYGHASGSGRIGNSTVSDAALRDYCDIRNSTITRGEYVNYTSIVGSTIDVARNNGRFDNVELRDCLVQGDGGGYVYLAALCATNAWIRCTTDAVSMPTRLGRLCAYRAVKDGAVQMRVSAGCQNRETYEALRRAARNHGVSKLEMEILDGFFVMADAAMTTWGIGERVPGEVTFSFDGYNEDDDDD